MTCWARQEDRAACSSSSSLKTRPVSSRPTCIVMHQLQSRLIFARIQSGMRQLVWNYAHDSRSQPEDEGDLDSP